MSGATITIYRSDSASYRLVRGPIKGWLVQHGIAGLGTPRLRGFMVREERISDLIAMAETEGFKVNVFDREARP